MHKVLVLLTAVCLLSACQSLLPTSRDKSIQPWKTFDEAKASFDRIEPFVTTFAAVRELGFDPYTTPNMKILNHAQVVQMVLPPPLYEHSVVPPGINACIKAQDACLGYYMEPSRLDKNRVGNFVLDFMNFRRETLTTGWRFGALVVVIGDTVVYKEWSGTPNIKEQSVQKNPLGPFQGLGASSGLYKF